MAEPRLLRSAPAPLRAVAALGLAFVLVLALSRVLRLPSPLAWLGLWGLAAMVLGGWLGLGRGWRTALLVAPWALQGLGRALPPWGPPALLLGLLLVFGGGLLTRVPLYHSNRAAWEALEGLLPPGPFRFVDLGAGWGGPLAFLARRRPDGDFLGVEASPLSWLVARLRILGRPNARMRLGSLWTEDLGPVDVAYAFLSPVPMPRLWEKARAEMRPGTLLLSHTFEVPGLEAERSLPLPGRPGACLRVYRLPESEV